ncbi:MAG: hypothetical protein GXD23_06845 [Comamonadaceae bacterium]|jgi:hypothetical protein|nr:hypothetical protein [Comamonadaceae bacterium]
MNARLARQQRGLLDALLRARPPGPASPWHGPGLGAYRANAHAHAERALLDAYPVVAALLGEEAFATLARALWHHHPPTRGDLGEWGGTLAGFIAEQTSLDHLPYLPDVARLEWALHGATRAEGARADAASFAWLEREPPERLRLRFAPATAVVLSRWPVLSLLDAHLHGEPDLATAARRLRDGVAENVRVWRQGQAVRLTPLDPASARFEAALLAGHTLAQALEVAPLDALGWLSEAVRSGLCVGVAPASEPSPNTTDGAHP